MTVHPEDRVSAFVAADTATDERLSFAVDHFTGSGQMVSDITRMGEWSRVLQGYVAYAETR